jgi:hypothetical protein
MQRTEKCRKRGKFEKTTKSPELGRPAGRSPEQQTLTIQQSLGLAMPHHVAKRLAEAKSIYR